MPKNIVICCDGTNGQFGSRNTNVVRLYALLRQDPVEQVAFYDPGIGTMSSPGALTRLAQEFTKLLGAAFAYGVTDRIEDAYRQIMASYEPGDRLYLFGFSRGAYIMRALAGLLHMCGLIRRGNENLVPYAIAMFGRTDERTFTLAREFKATFSRECPIHFVGVWDTVSSVGWIYSPVKFPYTANNPSIAVGRHAVSIDERRCYFRQNLWGPPKGNQDLRQVWFAGAHSDIGGGYAPEESGLANITLRWMASEAARHGLLLDEARLARLDQPEFRPDPLAPMHKSLRGWWWLLEFWPKRYMDMRLDPPMPRLEIPAGRRRWIAPQALVHESVVRRRNDPSARYAPVNLPPEAVARAEEPGSSLGEPGDVR